MSLRDLNCSVVRSEALIPNHFRFRCCYLRMSLENSYSTLPSSRQCYRTLDGSDSRGRADHSRDQKNSAILPLGECC